MKRITVLSREPVDGRFRVSVNDGWGESMELWTLDRIKDYKARGYALTERAPG